jgi:N-ethylmaleimide reductase
LRISPVTPANDIVDADPQPLFDYLVGQLAPLGLSYLHVIEGSTGGPRDLPDRPFDYTSLKAIYRAAGGTGCVDAEQWLRRCAGRAGVGSGR